MGCLTIYTIRKDNITQTTFQKCSRFNIMYLATYTNKEICQHIISKLTIELRLNWLDYSELISNSDNNK